jgi:ADP-ribosylglycohydrolase
MSGDALIEAKREEMDALTRARCSLEGLSVGDSFGERFFVSPGIVEYLIESRAVPRGEARGDSEGGRPVWPYTDDTMMALSIYACLSRFGRIDQDWLASDFARRYDMGRGYGPAMHRYLGAIWQGADWRVEAPALFGGSGSFGNGAAMRVAPLGAYFADDLPAVVENARLSAEVTHAHPEGIAGAIAVAVAAAFAWRLRGASPLPRERNYLEMVKPHIPDSEVHEGVRRAAGLAPGCSSRLAVSALGNGTRVSAQDTVPFALWCAARHLDDYEEALWLTVSGLGDRDTTCAIVGGIVTAHTGIDGIPDEWRRSREPLPAWAVG